MHFDVGWPRARRYGILIRMVDGAWRLWWLDNTSLVSPSILRHLVGGGRAIVKIPDESRSEVPARDLLDRLLLSEYFDTSDRRAPAVPR